MAWRKGVTRRSGTGVAPSDLREVGAPGPLRLRTHVVFDVTKRVVPAAASALRAHSTGASPLMICHLGPAMSDATATWAAFDTPPSIAASPNPSAKPLPTRGPSTDCGPDLRTRQPDPHPSERLSATRHAVLNTASLNGGRRRFGYVDLNAGPRRPGTPTPQSPRRDLLASHRGVVRPLRIHRTLNAFHR